MRTPDRFQQAYDEERRRVAEAKAAAKAESEALARKRVAEREALGVVERSLLERLARAKGVDKRIRATSDKKKPHVRTHGLAAGTASVLMFKFSSATSEPPSIEVSTKGKGAPPIHQKGVPEDFSDVRLDEIIEMWVRSVARI